MEVASRSELKSEILKDIERHKQQLNAYRGNPSISEKALDLIIEQLDMRFEALNSMVGKMGSALSESDFLNSVRSRTAIPGGTCEFDLPAYHAWQHQDSGERRADIQRWAHVFQPMNASVNLLLSLMRDTGTTQKMMAMGGQFQQSLAQGRFMLMRVAIDPSLRFIPEISGNRLMIWVRMMRQDGDGRLQHSTDDVPFEMALCV
jgi:cell division protein ZapD